MSSRFFYSSTGVRDAGVVKAKPTDVVSTRPVLKDITETGAASHNTGPVGKAPRKTHAPKIVTDDPEPTTTVARTKIAQSSTSSRSSKARVEVSTTSSQLVDDDDDVAVAPPPPPEDIDRYDSNAPQQASAYVKEIYEYLHEMQQKQRIDADYMTRQTDISASMRELLIGWMGEVSSEFQLMNETHFLAVSIVDQFLSRSLITRDKLQLVGMVGMFLASKYEEIYHPPIEDFVYVSAGTYDREQMVAMELKVLQVLNYDLSFVSSLHFLRRFSKAASSEPRMHSCCKYFLELALPKYSMLAFSPSMIAASAVYLARMLAGKKPVWNETLAYYTKFSERALLPCVKAFISILRAEAQAENISAISEKFSSKDHFRVATSVLGYYRKY